MPISPPASVSRRGRRPLVALFSALLVALTFALPLQTASAASRQVIVNGNFDKGTAGWTVTDSGHKFEVNQSGRSGSLGAQITPSNSATVVLGDQKSTVTSTVAGNYYSVALRVRSSRTDVTAEARVVESNGAGNATFTSPVKLSSTDWTKVTLDFTPKRSGSSLDMEIRFTGTQAGQSVYVDDVSFLEVAGSAPTATPTAAPTMAPTTANPVQCTRSAPPKGTQFGSSVSMSSTIWLEDALADRDSRFGKIAAVRIWDEPMPFSWDASRLNNLAGRTLVMSFRPKPADVLSGKYDAQLREWFQKAPSTSTIYWNYYHEPETPIDDQKIFSSSDYKKAWQHIDKIADSVCRPNMYSVLVLMSWTTNPSSKKDWHDYYPGSDVIDVIAFDPYNGVHDPTRDYYATPASMMDSVVAVAKEAGKPWGIAEIGSRKIPSDATGAKRATWLTDVANYTRSKGALFVTYFQSTRDGEWRLLDKPSMDAWRAAVSSSPR